MKHNTNGLQQKELHSIRGDDSESLCETAKNRTVIPMKKNEMNQNFSTANPSVPEQISPVLDPASSLYDPEQDPESALYDPAKDPDSPFYGKPVSPNAAETEDDGFEKWISIATDRIVFAKERKLARQELQDHYRDRVEAFLTLNMPKNTARKTALERLGNPYEVRAMLARVHQPWLSWILRLTRILLLLLLLTVVLPWGIRKVIPTFDEMLYYSNRIGWLYGEDNTLDVWNTLSKRSGGTVSEGSLGPFHVDLSAANQLLLYTNGDGYCSCETRLLLRFTAAPWYSPDRTQLLQNLKLTDNHGRVYYCNELPQSSLSSHEAAETRDYMLSYDEQIGWKLWETYFSISIFYNDFDWLELQYEGNGQTLNMRINFASWIQENPEGLQALTDQSEAIRQLEALDPFFPDQIEPSQEVSRQNYHALGVPGDGSLAVLRTWHTHWRENPGRLADSRDRYVTDCILLFRGSLWTAPSAYSDPKKTLTVTKTGSEESFDIHAYTPLVFRDSVLLRIQWPCEEALEQYTLTFTGGASPVVLSLIPGEEDIP